MKLQPDRIEGVNAIVRHAADTLTIQGPTGVSAWTRSVIVPFQGEVTEWPCQSVDTLQREDFDALLQYRPELVIFGSGPRMRFASPALTQGLIAARVGIECMDTVAACRTYNVLVSEGRRVVAALILGGATPM